MATGLMRARRFVPSRPILEWLTLLVLLSVLVACSSGAPIGVPSASSAGSEARPGTVKVDILYLNHPPVRPVLTEMDQVLAKYSSRVTVNRYDFDTPEGAAFAKEQNVTEHTPLAIFIKGSMEYTLNGRPVKFYSFPQGQGTGMVPNGTWSMNDLDAVLAQVAGSKA